MPRRGREGKALPQRLRFSPLITIQSGNSCSGKEEDVQAAFD